MEMRTTGIGLRSAVEWFFKTVWRVLAHPFVVFRELPRQAGLGKPLVFLAVLVILDAAYTWLLQPLGLLTNLPTTGLTPIEEEAMGALALVFMPLIAFGAARLLGGKGKLADAVAMTCYANAPLILPSISYLGYAFAAYGIFIYFVGLKETFRLSHRRAFFAFLLFGLGLILAEGGAAYVVVAGLKL
jgi:hypothetical protein